ncbi:MAG: lipopolysaccharide assembly protein LapA domain-containing protein, partial [Limisphaerales bacterium]
MAKLQDAAGSGKLVIFVILLVLIIVALMQNTPPVSLKFLFWTVAMPRALLILISAIVGLILGILLTLRASKKN